MNVVRGIKVAVGAALLTIVVIGMDAGIASAQEPPRRKSIFDDPEETTPQPPPPKPKPRPDPAEKQREITEPVVPKPLVPKVVRIERGPVPDAFAIGKAEAALAEQLKSGESPQERLAASTRLLESARNSGEDRAARFVQLRRSAELAATAADLDLAFSVLDEQSRYFEVDVAAMRRELVPLAAAGAVTPEHHEAVALHILQMTRFPLPSALRLPSGLSLRVEDRLEEDGALHEEATRLVNLAETAAIKARKPALAAKVRDRAGNLRLARSIFDEARLAMEKLRTSPDDSSANFFVGRYLCFVKHQWEEGVPYLAKGMDPNTKAVAQAELVQAELAQSFPEVPADPKAWLKIAEKWNEMGRAQQGLLRVALIGRSIHWYRKAQISTSPPLDDLDRALVDKRLATSRLLVPDLPELVQKH